MDKRRVVITGLGAVTPFGVGVDKFWESLKAGKSGISTSESIDISKHVVKISGEVKDFNPEDYMDGKEAKKMDRFIQFAMVAADEAIKDSKIQEIKNQYEELNTQYRDAMKELEVFRAADETRKQKEHKDEIDAIVNEFSKKLSRVPEFLIYKARLDYSKSTDDVRKELTLMAGKSVMDTQTKANFDYSPVYTTFSNKGKKDRASDRYGNLLDKFIK